MNMIKTTYFSKSKLQTSISNLRITAPVCVALLALIFSFWLLPIKYINPAHVGWIFTMSLDNFADGAGHAIQSMFFGQELWQLPPGKLVTFGGPVGASLIFAAVSPVLAIPAKLMETVGLIGPFWQFIGIQAVLGICLTALAVYFLGLALGASEIASAAAALLCLPLPNLFGLAIFNESLSWQFLAIVPMILLLNDKKPQQPLWLWPVTMGLAIWSNTYFAAMILAFFGMHLLVIRCRYHTRFLDLGKELFIVMSVALVLHYLGGGFLLSISAVGSSVGVMDFFSVKPLDLFHIMPEGQGYVYRGLTVFALFIAWGIWRLVQCAMYRGGRAVASEFATSPKTIFIPTLFAATALFVISLGPIIHFGTVLSLKSPLPEPLLQAISMFRAIGRFSWPFIYLLLGLAALAIDALVKAVPAVSGKRRFILLPFCLLLISLQFLEFYPEIMRYKHEAKMQAGKKLMPNPVLDAAISTSHEIVFIPAYDQSELGTERGIPWNSLSYYAIKYHVPIYTYQWLGRNDPNAADRIRNLTIADAVECRWVSDRVYVLKRLYIPQISHCNYPIDEVASYPNWVVFKLKQGSVQ